MTEVEFIKNLKKLKQIKPSQEWVLSCREEIMKEEDLEVKASFADIFSIFKFNPYMKPVLATVLSLGFLIGIFGGAQNALPGDLLFSAKKMTENAQISLSSEDKRPMMQLELTNKRLAELSKVAEENLGGNLVPALIEVEKASTEAAQSLKEIVEVSDGIKQEDVVKQVQRIKEQKVEIEKKLAVQLFTSELDDSINFYYKSLVEAEIEQLEGQILTEEQEITLEEIKVLFEQEKYEEVLEKILLEINISE